MKCGSVGELIEMADSLLVPGAADLPSQASNRLVESYV
jgi:hypothetical protein